jgi:hypothetical protein
LPKESAPLAALPFQQMLWNQARHMGERQAYHKVIFGTGSMRSHVSLVWLDCWLRLSQHGWKLRYVERYVLLRGMGSVTAFQLTLWDITIASSLRPWSTRVDVEVQGMMLIWCWCMTFDYIAFLTCYLYEFLHTSRRLNTF